MLEYKLCEMFGGVTILAENKSSLSVSEEQFSGNGSIVGRFRGGLLPTMICAIRPHCCKHPSFLTSKASEVDCRHWCDAPYKCPVARRSTDGLVEEFTLRRQQYFTRQKLHVNWPQCWHLRLGHLHGATSCTLSTRPMQTQKEHGTQIC